MTSLHISLRLAALMLTVAVAIPADAQQIFTWGDNTAGQAEPQTLTQIVQVAAGDKHTLALDAYGIVHAWGDNSKGQVNVPGTLQPVKAIAAAGDVSWALQQDGTVVGWGDPASPALRGPHATAPGMQLTAGRNFVVVLDAFGMLHGWGDNSDQQIPATTSNNYKAIAAGAAHTLALTGEGLVEAFGNNDHQQRDVPATLRNVIAVAAGANHSVALRADATVVAWGKGDDGQLDVSGLTNVKAIACGDDFTVYLKANGTVEVRGNNTFNQASPPNLANIIAVAGGGRHGVAISGSGRRVIAWGKNDFQESTLPASFVNDHVLQVSASVNHSVVLKDDGTVYCWGQNVYGQCNVPAGTANVKAVVAGPTITYALLANGMVAQWGSGGTTTIRSQSQQVISIQGGYASLNSSGEPFVNAGAGNTGSLGIFNIHTIRTGQSSATWYNIAADGNVSEWQQRTHVQDLPVAGVVDVGVGRDHWIAIYQDGTATGQGGAFGEGTVPPGTTGIVQAAGGANHSLLRLANGSALAWGEVTPEREAFIPPGATGVVQLSAGLRHNLAVVTGPTTNLYPPDFVKGADVVVPEGSGQASYTSWATAIDAGLGESSQTVSFSLSGYDAALFAAPPTIDASGTLRFTPAEFMNGTTTVTVVAIDNGTPVAQGAAQQFTITITPVNSPPLFTAGNNVTALEDTPTTVPHWATGISSGRNESGQQLNFTLTDYDPTLFSTAPAIDANGTLTFTPATDANGSTSVTVRLHDDGGGLDTSAPVSFQLTISPVNDPPTAMVPTDIAVKAGDVLQPITVSNISPGPPNEASQAVTVTATADATFAGDIVVTQSANGDATVALTAWRNDNHDATLTITLTDNGGTDNNGQNATRYNIVVHVQEISGPLFVPTVFSPNGDGTNDVFRIRATMVKTVDLAVYERNGQQVFHTNDIQEATQSGWNGTHGGATLPAGSYTWVLHGEFMDGTPMSFEGKQYGQVVLLR